MRPLRLHSKWFAALCLLGCSVAAESSPPVLTLNVTYYDFRVHEDARAVAPVSYCSLYSGSRRRARAAFRGF